MTPIELVQRISGGTKELVLDQPLLRLNIRRTRSNPCHFDDFLSALGLGDLKNPMGLSGQDDWGYPKPSMSEAVLDGQFYQHL
jgi:hypothetical protein